MQNGYSSGGFISDVEAWGEMKNSIGWDVADALELSSPIGIHFQHTLFNYLKNPENTHLNRTIISVENKSIIIIIINYILSRIPMYPLCRPGKTHKKW